MNHKEICNKLDGVKAPKTQMTRTKKMGKRGLTILGVLIVGAFLVSASLLLFYGGFVQQMEVEPTILVDGIDGGIITELASFDIQGGNTYAVDHTIENVGDVAVDIDMTELVEEETGLDIWTPIALDEIVCSYYIEAESPLSYGTGTNTMTRTIDTNTVVWSMSIDIAPVILIISSDTTPDFKVEMPSDGVWNYYAWTGSDWGSAHSMSQGVKYEGVTITSLASNPRVVTIDNTVLDTTFYWGFKVGTTQLTVPSGWSPSTPTVGDLADGNVPLTFPRTVEASELIEFTVEYAIHPLIGPGSYRAEFKVLPD